MTVLFHFKFSDFMEERKCLLENIGPDLQTLYDSTGLEVSCSFRFRIESRRIPSSNTLVAISSTHRRVTLPVRLGSKWQALEESFLYLLRLPS